ncbi:CDP-alcohol phosphatidyltransferase family protein [Sphingobium algorifonticola]|uniref:CDP-alcohol phosphatidyltransferase family protein n=1 Tax=Sphingobium algorifonticola TaxID=2008318 RepID=A0A437JBT3_9SPHN|nr:CDP-alcohol phosphatidyltransferase family protein [Sphingobium algorifonticola]RVT43386.1 CDP-alcohol phosphatidyltransferase family protein [Sphingobium algorifonticola]
MTTETIRFTGANDTPIWGMSNAERLRRMVAGAAKGGQHPADGHVLHANLAYAFDPLLLRLALDTPGSVFRRGDDLVLAHLPEGTDPMAVGDHVTDLAKGEKVYNRQLRKLEVPFARRLTPETRRAIERQSYFGAYKGVTDILTKYLWPELALFLTRIAAQLRMTPNMVTAIGALCCVLATLFFAEGQYWAGMASAFVFMVFDTVDGKLARCTITSSKWGNVFDHGIDLIHPPFWWYAWGVGLAAHGLTLENETFAILMIAIVAGYVLQRLIEGAFIKDFGMDIHVWQRFDSQFRLITARRNPNMVILFVSLLVGRPDQGLLWLAIWTVISLIVHAVRLAQAYAARAAGGTITSWLEQRP